MQNAHRIHDLSFTSRPRERHYLHQTCLS
ncbi:hypothetical protein M3J09_009984 [Ascochyta lentis]